MVHTVLISIGKLIGKFLISEALFLKNVGKELVRLQDELHWMASFLEVVDASRKSDDRVENWVREIKNITYQPEDLLESFLLKVEKRKREGRGFIGVNICVQLHN